MGRIWRSSSWWTNLRSFYFDTLNREGMSTMAWISSRKGAAENLALPLMIGTFVVIGGFMYWLSVTAEPTQIAIIEDRGDVVVADGARVGWGQFSADPSAWAGQSITIPDIAVNSLLGSGQAFWSQMSDAQETPFLFKFGDQLVADGMVVIVGDVGDASGTLLSMSDSILNAWEAAGAFNDPVNRIEAEFATTFFEVETFLVDIPEGG